MRATVLATALVFAGPAMALPRTDSDARIETAFYKCNAPRLLEGGIYAKGPFHRFPSSTMRFNCRNWVRISKKEFTTLATEWFKHDWSSDLPWWRE